MAAQGHDERCGRGRRLGLWAVLFGGAAWATRKALHLAYRFTPDVMGVGGWNGRSDAEICAYLNPSTTVTHWHAPANEALCAETVARKGWGLEAGVALLLSVYIVKRLIDVLPEVVRGPPAGYRRHHRLRDRQRRRRPPRLRVATPPVSSLSSPPSSSSLSSSPSLSDDG